MRAVIDVPAALVDSLQAWFREYRPLGEQSTTWIAITAALARGPGIPTCTGLSVEEVSEAQVFGVRGARSLETAPLGDLVIHIPYPVMCDAEWWDRDLLTFELQSALKP